MVTVGPANSRLPTGLRWSPRPERAIPPDEYERAYDSLLARTRPRLKGLVLMTPFFIEPLRADPMRARMDVYGGIVKKLAERHRAICVDTQAALDRFLTHHHSGALALDRVHPNPIGHMILARAFLDVIGFKW